MRHGAQRDPARASGPLRCSWTVDHTSIIIVLVAASRDLAGGVTGNTPILVHDRDGNFKTRTSVDDGDGSVELPRVHPERDRLELVLAELIVARVAVAKGSPSFPA